MAACCDSDVGDVTVAPHLLRVFTPLTVVHSRVQAAVACRPRRLWRIDAPKIGEHPLTKKFCT